MNLVKTCISSAAATIVRIIAGIISSKIMAIYVGPAGIALLGQFNNYANLSITIGSGAINSGVTKYIAEYSSDSSKQKLVVSTSLGIAFYCSLLLGGINIVFASQLSSYLFNNTEYYSVFYIFGFSLVFISLNTILLAILNGYKQIKLYIGVGMFGNFIALGVTWFLASKYSIYGVLISAVISQALTFFISYFFIRKFYWFNFNFLRKIDKSIVRNLFQYTTMAIIMVFAGSSSQILVRNYLIQHLSLEQAGYWQATWRISEIYLMIITNSLVTYYLPRLSEITDNKELRKEILRGYKILIPITFFTAISIYMARNLIISILFTSQFLAMQDLFLFQLIGDVFKISAWLLGYIMVAKAMTKLVIAVELLFNFSFYIFTCFFVSQFQLIGVTYAYALNYLLFLLFVLFALRKIIWRAE